MAVARTVAGAAVVALTPGAVVAVRMLERPARLREVAGHMRVARARPAVIIAAGVIGGILSTAVARWAAGPRDQGPM